MPWSAATIGDTAWAAVREALRSNVSEYQFVTYVDNQFPTRVREVVPAWVCDESPREP